MKIKIIDGVVEEGKHRHVVGDIVDFEKEEGMRLICLGVGEEVEIHAPTPPALATPEDMTKEQLLTALHKLKVQAAPRESKEELLKKFLAAKKPGESGNEGGNT